MLQHADELDISNLPHAETIIVGSGAVGLTMAIDLARKNHSVILLEAGSNEISKASQRFFENAKSTSHKLEGLHLGRFRLLGGTTNFWGGQLVRFDSIVFQNRPWVHAHSSWPINLSDLEPFYDYTLKMLGMESACRSDDSIIQALKITPPNTNEHIEFFFTRWLPEPNLARFFYEEIINLPNLKIILDAPVVALVENNEESNKVKGVEIIDKNGRRLSITGDNIVLANGTIEIARLLLLPYSNNKTTPWSNNPWLGRGFMEHIDCIVGDVTVTDKKKFHNTFDNAIVNNLKYQPKLKLSEKAQQEQQLVGVACHFIFNSSVSEHLTNAKIFFKALLKGRLNGSIWSIPKQLLTVLTVGLPMILRYVRYRRIYNPADQGIQIRITSEQKMVITSQIRLLDEKDSLNMPILELDWQINKTEIETIARFSEMISQYLESNGLGRVTLHEKIQKRDLSFFSSIDDANHHMGMVRMSNTPSEGVVNRDLRIHGMQNIYVAGAATFPSTGFPNPTFTAIALGLRLTSLLHHKRSE